MNVTPSCVYVVRAIADAMSSSRRYFSGFAVGRELQIQVAQRLIALLLPPEPVLRDPVGDLRVLPVAQLLDDLVERLR